MTTLGRWLEVTGKLKANAALDAIARLLPEEVRRIRDGVEELIPLGQVRIDDLLRVLPGERFPADGCLVEPERRWSTSKCSPARAGRSSRSRAIASWAVRSTWTEISRSP